jgi:predicted dehydrogenase
VAPREESLLSVIAGDLELRLTPESLEVVEAGQRITVQHTEPATAPAGKPGLAACQTAFLEAVKSGEPRLVRSSFADAARTLELALAANESAQTGKVISL